MACPSHDHDQFMGVIGGFHWFHCLKEFRFLLQQHVFVLVLVVYLIYEPNIFFGIIHLNFRLCLAFLFQIYYLQVIIIRISVDWYLYVYIQDDVEEKV